MLRTEGYMKKKVWENGRLREDIEMSEKGNDEGVRLVIRDKDVVEDISIPREAILRAMFSEKPSSRSLTERLVELVGTCPTRLSSTKAPKTKAKTKKAPKKSKRKTVRNARKTKRQGKKTLQMVCRMK